MTDPHFDYEAALWARVRDDYRAGMTAAEVCRRHGVGRSSFYARAQAERWRRADQPGAALLPEEDDFDAAQPRRSAGEMAEQAHRRMAHAVEKGRLREALGWARLAKELRALTLEEENISWRRLRAAQREAEAAAAEQPRAAEAARTPAPDSHAPPMDSPPPLQLQVLDPAGEEGALPDSPDIFFESATAPIDAVLPPEVFEACRAILRSQPDTDRAWEEMLPLLKAARPDVPWDGPLSAEDDGEEDPWDEGREPPPSTSCSSAAT